MFCCNVEAAGLLVTVKSCCMLLSAESFRCKDWYGQGNVEYHLDEVSSTFCVFKYTVNCLLIKLDIIVWRELHIVDCFQILVLQCLECLRRQIRCLPFANYGMNSASSSSYLLLIITFKTCTFGLTRSRIHKAHIVH